MTKRFLLLVLVCVTLLQVQVGQALAISLHSKNNDGQLFTTKLSESNFSLSGNDNVRQLYFQIPSYWIVDDVKLKLDYRVSSLIREGLSSVTIQVNDTYVHSFRPIHTEDKKESLTITIPKELVKSGANLLSIVGDNETRENDGRCMVDGEHDNWLQLFNTSTIEMRYQHKPLTGAINQFNEYFTGLDIASKEQHAFIVPDESTPAELTAATYAIAGYSKRNSINNKAIPLLTIGSNTYQSKKAGIMIAQYDHLPKQIQAKVQADQDKQTATIQVVNLNNKPILVITSHHEDMLVLAGRFAANYELMSQIAKSRKVIDKETNVDTPAVQLTKQIVLNDNGDQVKGENHQEKDYFIPLPANRTIADASKVSLSFRYARNLDFDRSMVTVRINDTPIGSKKLSSEMADNDHLMLQIPTNLNISGNFTVTVAFDLQLKGDSCVRREDEMPWAFITKDSALQLNTADNTELLLNHYPYPFSRDGNFNQIAVVMPTERDSYTYQSLANVFSLLGKYVEGNTGEIQYYNDSVSAEALKNHNIIVLGTYKNNKIIRDNNSSLYFQYDPNGEGFISNEKMSIETEYGKRIGALQLIQSPYGAGRGMMTLTGAKSEYYYLVSKLIGTESALWNIYGDGVTIDKDGNRNAYRFKKEADQEKESIIDQLTERSDLIGYMIVILLVFVLVVVSLIFMLRKYRNKRRHK